MTLKKVRPTYLTIRLGKTEGLTISGEIESDPKQSRLDTLGKALGPNFAHLARSKSGRHYLEQNGCYTVVATEPKKVLAVLEILTGLGFEVQVEDKMCESTNWCKTTFEFLGLLGNVPSPSPEFYA